MEKLPFVDAANLFIWGHSMGGTIAPEVAKLHHPKGIMVFGCVFRPWSEFLLEMHRVQKPLLDHLTYQQTEDFTRKIQKIYYEFFVLKKSPEQLVEIPNTRPRHFRTRLQRLKRYVGTPLKFWQQLDSARFGKKLAGIELPGFGVARRHRL
jgi:hypothetical protein